MGDAREARRRGYCSPQPRSMDSAPREPYSIRQQAREPNKVADAAAVHARTLEEVQKGLMRGPFAKEQVDAAYGVGGWRPMRTGLGYGRRERYGAAITRSHRCTTSAQQLSRRSASIGQTSPPESPILSSGRRAGMKPSSNRSAARQKTSQTPTGTSPQSHQTTRWWRSTQGVA